MNILKLLLHHRLFALEWLVFVKFGSLALTSVAYNILVQDKICLERYKQTMDFCQHINLIKDEEGIQMVNQILKDSSKFIFYKSVIEFVPSFLWSLLVGSFLDHYAGAARTLLILSAAGDFASYLVLLPCIYYPQWSPYWTLLSSIQICFTGGITSFLTIVLRYIAHTTEEKARPIKFALFEAFFIMGLSLGGFLGGKALALNDLGSKRARTYEHNYFVAIVLAFVAFGLVFGLKHAKKISEEPVKKKEAEIVIESNSEEEAEPHRRTSSISAVISDEIEHIKEETKVIATKLFSFDNVIETVKCLFRSRSNRARASLLTMFYLTMISVVTFIGIETLFLDFSQKVYHWSPSTYTTAAAFSKVGTTIFLTIWVIIFVNRFHMDERKLIVMGLLSSFLYQTMLGTFPSPTTYMIAIPVGSFSGLISISVRSMMTKIVPQDEVGKIFSLITTFESGLPLLTSAIYANLFSATIDFHPGLIYQFSGFLVLSAFVVYIWEEFYTHNLPKGNQTEIL